MNLFVAFRLVIVLALSGVLALFPRVREPENDGAGPTIVLRLTDAHGASHAVATNPNATRLEQFSCADGRLAMTGAVAPVAAFPVRVSVDVADYAAGVRSIKIIPPENARVENVSANLTREGAAAAPAPEPLSYQPADRIVSPRIVAHFDIAPADPKDAFWSSAAWKVVATDAFGQQRTLAGAPLFNPSALCEAVAAMPAAKRG